MHAQHARCLRVVAIGFFQRIQDQLFFQFFYFVVILCALTPEASPFSRIDSGRSSG